MLTDNLVQTFQLEDGHLRGRIVRLGSAIHDMLERHAYPEPVARLTGEAALLALLLSSMLKYDGIFTLQTQGDGPVSMLVADIARRGVIRACAKFDAARLDPAMDFTHLLGRGHLAFTVDQGPGTERYQGIVDLSGQSLQDSVQHYFTQSEQIATGIRIAVNRTADERWRAGAIMLQRLPEQNAPTGETGEDSWRHAMVLLESCKDEELLSPGLTQNDLLFRLFHEGGVRVYDPEAVAESCRCSTERAENILRMMTEEERQDMAVNGEIVVTCEFCNREYRFDRK